MKYVLMLVRDDDEWEAMTDAERNMPAIGAWFMDLAAKGQLRGGEQLEAVSTARTVTFADGKPVVTDGPFMETKEAVGGFGIVEVADIDEAVAIARTWPTPRAHKVEVRPIVKNH